jgi:hypothetical protein
MTGQIFYPLREGGWWNRRRARAYLALLAGGNVIGFIIAICHAHGWLLPQNPHFSTEFMGFYAAGKLVNAGAAILNYAPGLPVRDYIASSHIAPAHAAMQQAVSGDKNIILFTFFYPPVSWLAFGPLARLPFYPAFFVWVGLTGGLCLTALRRLTGNWRLVWPAAAYLSVYETAGVGENGFLIAALLGYGFLALDKHPWRAGLLFGLLCFKPPLLLPLGLLLLFGRRWRALLAMGASASALCALAGFVFGWAAWWDYFGVVVPHAEWMLRHWGFSYAIQVTPFAAIRLLGGGIPAADLVQLAATLFATYCLFIAARRGDTALMGAMLCASLPLFLSVMIDYDLTVTGLAIAFLVHASRHTGNAVYVKWTVCLLFLLPCVTGLFRTTWHLPVDLLLDVAILLLLLSRIAAMSAAPPPPQPAG